MDKSAEEAAVDAAVKDGRPYDVVAGIMAYENGELDEDEMIELYQHLVNSGLIWHLQGSYGRQARRMIEAGIISEPQS